MKIFQDVFTEQEFLSDSYPINLIFEEVIGQVKSRLVAKTQGDVDIGCGNAFGGQNEDQEQGGQGGSTVEKVVDLVDAFGYEQTSFDKAGFQAYFKVYMKKILDHLTAKKQDRLEAFKNGGRQFFKWALANFDELSFYTGKSYDTQNLIVMSYYKKEDDEAPTFLYVMDGFKFIKV